MTGSAYALTLTLPAAGFRVTAGEAVVGGLHAPDLHHFHCSHCLSWVFTQPETERFVNLRASMLDDATWFRPFADMYVSEQLAFAETAAPRRFERFPDLSVYPELAAAYAIDGARPH